MYFFNNNNNRIRDEKTSEIEELVLKQDRVDRYILDEENAIIVKRREIVDKYILDDDIGMLTLTKEDSNGYTMIHERLINGELVEINRWDLERYCFGIENIDAQIKELNLFLVQGISGEFDSIYNYKEDRFIVLPNIWDKVSTGYRHSNILDKYNGFFATFKISSDFEKSDLIAYNSLVTGERVSEDLGVYDGRYYAIINLDGTIRGNKLFKGDFFSKITDIIDLDEYDSVEAFKNERKQICNKKKEEKKRKYFELLESRNDDTVSPYLDKEVVNILKLKR